MSDVNMNADFGGGIILMNADIDVDGVNLDAIFGNDGFASALSDDVKQAILTCFQHVAWVDDQGQAYYNALYNALYPLLYISAVYTQSGTVYDTDSLNTLKADLVVTAHYGDGSTSTVAATDYTLSGSLAEGTSTITVFYGGKATTFNVTVSHAATTYTVTNSLTHVTTSNVAASVAEYAAYLATLTAEAGYDLDSVTVTMGGVDVTASYYSSGDISIPAVTGDLVITATATVHVATLVSISAAYTQSGTVYDTDPLDSLKSDLVVTATYSDSSTSTVAANDYTLSGTLTTGTSTITVSYGGQSDTFNVTVSASPKSDMNGWSDGIAYTDLTIVANEYIHTGSGAIRTYSGWDRTGYVPCDGASTLVFPPMAQAQGQAQTCNWFYDANKSPVSGFTLTKDVSNTITVPSTAAFFIVSYVSAPLADMIEAGIVPNA